MVTTLTKCIVATTAGLPPSSAATKLITLIPPGVKPNNAVAASSHPILTANAAIEKPKSKNPMAPSKASGNTVRNSGSSDLSALNPIITPTEIWISTSSHPGIATRAGCNKL